MKIRVDMTENFDLDAAVAWAVAQCVSFKYYRVVEIMWEAERTNDEVWFQLEVEFSGDNAERDAGLFLLRWSE